MNVRPTALHHPRGFTLLEMSMVILVLMALVSVGFYGNNAFTEWRLAREASETLRTVYVAQRTYLADNPTQAVNTLTHAKLLPYLPNNPATFPTGKSLTGGTLTVYVGVSPPFFTTSSTSSGASVPSRYDLSGKTTDSLWDAGE